MNYEALLSDGKTYDQFLADHANEAQLGRWKAVHDGVSLDSSQVDLLASFTRRMNVLVSAGAWCGDCINQCPIFDHFARANDQIVIRFYDRDEHSSLAEQLSTCGGHRVPSVLFLSEDFFVCGRYGDRTLATYRHMAETQLGPSCPTGIGAVDQSLLQAVAGEWLEEFERIQLMLRLSGRLRQVHND